MKKQPGLTLNRSLFGVTACLGMFALLSFGSAWQESATFDEPIHLLTGYTILKTGVFLDQEPMNPPLIRLWTTWPLLFLKLDYPAHISEPLQHQSWAFSHHFLYENRLSPDWILNIARGMNTMIGIGLGFLIWYWSRQTLGIVAAWASLISYCFCPVILAHASLVTTDLGVTAFSFLSMYLLWRYTQNPSSGRAATAGAGFGLALASKLSALLFIPSIATILFVDVWLDKSKRKSAKTIVWDGLGYASGLVLILGLAFAGSHARLFSKECLAVFSEVSTGGPTYLMGRFSQTGWWYYFLVAVLLKTPLPLLLLAILGVLATLLNLLPQRAFLLKWVLLPMAVFLAIASGSKYQSGIQHVLPIFPFLCLMAGACAAALWNSLARGKMIVLFLAAYYAGTALWFFPRYLFYFNEIAGGPSQGYRYLLNSNLDLGQGLKALGRYLQEQHVGKIYLSYFGSGDPHAYGIRYVPVQMVTNAPLMGDGPLDLHAEPKVLLVVSISNLEGLFTDTPNRFHWPRQRQPLVVLMDSLYVYDITHDVDAHRRLAQWFREWKNPVMAEQESRWN